MTQLLGPCVLNKKSAPKGELTLRTSVITHGSKGELALRGTFLYEYMVHTVLGT